MSEMNRQTVSDAELATLRALGTDKMILELGSAQGISTAALCGFARQVWSVDWHRGDLQAGEGDTLPAFLARTNADRYFGRLVVAVGSFTDVLPLLAPAGFDLIFHDGFHDAAAVAHDLRLALPLLTWDGYIAAHDYGLFGVKQGSESVLGPPDLVVQSLAVWGPNRGRFHI